MSARKKRAGADMTVAVAKILGVLADGGTVRGLRLYPGPWHYVCTPKREPGEKQKPEWTVSEGIVTELAGEVVIHGVFEDRGQNTHALDFQLTELGRHNLAVHDAKPETIAAKNKKASRGAA